VLKDILLVFASMLLFKDPVSLLQAFGYSIALAGMIYYKLGMDKIKESVAQGGMAWAEFGAKRPVTRKLVVLGSVLFAFIMVLISFGPGYSPVSSDQIYS
jgi:hypothetical protein